jgi:hypothetical protein
MLAPQKPSRSHYGRPPAAKRERWPSGSLGPLDMKLRTNLISSGKAALMKARCYEVFGDRAVTRGRKAACVS